MNRFEKIRRYSWALLLLTLPLFSYPLAWSMFFKGAIPAWDLFKGCTPAVIALAALAAAVAEPGRIIKAWQSSKLLRAFIAGALLCAAAAGVQQIIYGGIWEYFFHGLFALTLPLAGMALAPELKRILPWWCGILFFLLLLATVNSPMCSGFVGNWNWNFSLLAVTLVAAVVLVFRSRRPLIAAGVFVSAGVFSVFFFFPELAPRGTLAGIIGAAAALGTALLFKRQTRWRYALLAALAGGTLFLAAINNQENATLANARIQLWRGSLDLALAHTVAGVGPARIESKLPPYLPPDYFLSDFPATSHPHPHNELLNMWAGFGLAGILYILTWAAASARQIRRKDPVGLWMLWSVLLLLIHGLFDVHLSVPLPGTLFFLMLGAICGSGLSGREGETPFLRKRYLCAAALLLLAGFFLCQHLRAGKALYEGKILLSQNCKKEALEKFRRSALIYPTAPALYMAGQVEFFDFHRPDMAIYWWLQIKNDLRMPSFLHVNRLLGHAFDMRGNTALALYYFEREAKDFPFSAINAGLRLGTLQKSGAPPEKIAAAANIFNKVMEMRKLPLSAFPELLRHPEKDDEPLVK